MLSSLILMTGGRNLSENGQRKLVLTITEEPASDHLSNLKVERFLAAVPLAAVKTDKEKALEQFSARDSGFKDRDPQPARFEASTGEILAAVHAKLFGPDVRDLKDASGREFGKELLAAAIEGHISEVSHLANICPSNGVNLEPA